MKQNLTLEALRQLLERRDMCALRDALTQIHPADLAELLDELDRPEMLAVFRALPKELAAEVFSDLPPEDQQALIQAATDQELSAIVEELWVDDAVDLLEELPAGVVKRVLQAARPDTRQLINQFLHYPENSVGSIMTAEFTDLKRDMTVAQAIAHIRRTGADSESIYTCYVTDAARRLEGVVTIRELLLAGDQALVADLMERDVITAGTGEDREEAVARLMKYDFLSLPVVDREGRLVGIVTVDDGMDVLEEEATEDFEKDAASMILADDNFATIVKAVVNGRSVYANIKNAIQFLLSGNTAGIFCVLYASLLALPVPFQPVHLLFINLLTDSLPAIAIGMEPARRGLLDQKPRDPKEPILSRDLLTRIGGQGLLIAIVTMIAFYLGYQGGDAVLASTMAFATLTLARLFHGFNCRGDASIFRLKFSTNKYSVMAFFAGVVLLLAVLFIPGLKGLFMVAPAFGVANLGEIVLLAFLPTLVIQIIKVIGDVRRGKEN